MRRPLPLIPRGPRRKKLPPPGPVLMGIPKVAPDWELAAIAALIKPQTRGAIVHRKAAQPWPRDGNDKVIAGCKFASERLAVTALAQMPDRGEYHVVWAIAPGEIMAARALAVLLSRLLPGTWIVLDRLFVHDENFYRRQRRFGLRLTMAHDIHLSRGHRAIIGKASELLCADNPLPRKRSKRSTQVRCST